MGDHPYKEDAMKYMMLINLGPQARDFQSLPQEEQQQIYAGWKALNETPGVTPGQQLQPPETATTVRAQDGQTLTIDGPYVETKEALDGYFIYEGEDLDAAIAVAARVPAVSMGGSVEVRPLAQWS
jgi:hypothetical protein